MNEEHTSARVHRLGDLQLSILQALWERGEATVGQVLESLGGGRVLAYTTVATMLRKMEARGLLAHREEGRSFVYRPRVAAQDVSRSMGDHFVNRLFEGSLTEAVSHLLATREVSLEELNQLEKLIREKRRRV
jgi:predicted transcriptional regulator